MDMESQVTNAIAEGLLVGVVMAFVMGCIWWLTKVFERVKTKAQENAPEMKERLRNVAASSAEHATRLTQSAGEKLRAAREAIQESNGGRMSKYEQLEKLGQLKEKGILSDEEFQSEKARILGQ
jgi:hypothetical protein